MLGTKPTHPPLDTGRTLKTVQTSSRIQFHSAGQSSAAAVGERETTALKVAALAPTERSRTLCFQATNICVT